MNVNDIIENNTELQQVLRACYKYWQIESSPPHKRAICYSWVGRLYEESFGTKFHQSKLRRLANIGFLKQEEISRGGSRRYKIVDLDRLADLLKSGY